MQAAQVHGIAGIRVNTIVSAQAMRWCIETLARTNIVIATVIKIVNVIKIVTAVKIVTVIKIVTAIKIVIVIKIVTVIKIGTAIVTSTNLAATHSRSCLLSLQTQRSHCRLVHLQA
jgi:hypothetical protein